MSIKIFGLTFGSSPKTVAADPMDQILAEAKAKAELAKAKKEEELKIKKETLEAKAKEAAKEAKAKEAGEAYLKADSELFQAEVNLAKTKEQAVGVMAKAIEARKSAEDATLAKVRAIKAAREAGFSPSEFASFMIDPNVKIEVEKKEAVEIVDPTDALWAEVVAAADKADVEEYDEDEETLLEPTEAEEVNIKDDIWDI